MQEACKSSCHTASFPVTLIRGINVGSVGAHGFVRGNDNGCEVDASVVEQLITEFNTASEFKDSHYKENIYDTLKALGIHLDLDESSKTWTCNEFVHGVMRGHQYTPSSLTLPQSVDHDLNSRKRW